MPYAPALLPVCQSCSLGPASRHHILLAQGGEKQGKVSKLVKNEVLMLNIGSMCTGARVIAVNTHSLSVPCPHYIVLVSCTNTAVAQCHMHSEHGMRVPLALSTHVLLVQVKHDLAKLQLTSPVCTKEEEKIALSRRGEKHWHLIGWGSISAGMLLKIFRSAERLCRSLRLHNVTGRTCIACTISEIYRQIWVVHL